MRVTMPIQNTPHQKAVLQVLPEPFYRAGNVEEKHEKVTIDGPEKEHTPEHKLDPPQGYSCVARISTMLNKRVYTRVVAVIAHNLRSQVSEKSATGRLKKVGDLGCQKVESDGASGNMKWPTRTLDNLCFVPWTDTSPNFQPTKPTSKKKLGHGGSSWFAGSHTHTHI